MRTLGRSTRAWRAFRTAAWVGWQIESNWAQPWVFAGYAVLKPMALAGLLTMMYAVINRGGFGSPAFTYMYVGNAFYLYVGAVMSGMGWAVLEDRERYRMLKSVYVAPIDLRAYLLGRGAARFVTGTASVLLTIVLGILVLRMPITMGTVNWPLLTVAMGLGAIVLGSMGLLVAAAMLLAGEQAWGLGELAAGAVYLVSGAIFPVTVLPRALQPVAEALPLTYWIELSRRALVGPVGSAFPLLATWSGGRLALTTMAVAIAWAAAAAGVFHVCETTARRRGLLDQTTNY